MLLQTIGSRQSGNTPADDGNRARSGLLGVSVPVQDGCERRRAAAAAESRNNCRLVSAEDTVFMRGNGKSLLYSGK